MANKFFKPNASTLQEHGLRNLIFVLHKFKINVEPFYVITLPMAVGVHDPNDKHYAVFYDGRFI